MIKSSLLGPHQLLLVPFITYQLLLFKYISYKQQNFKKSVSILFTVPILLGNDRKIDLKWKQNSMSSSRYVYGAKNLKIIRLLQAWYIISVNYMAFKKFQWIPILYLKNWEFLQNLKNRVGDKSKLPKWKSLAGIGSNFYLFLRYSRLQSPMI